MPIFAPRCLGSAAMMVSVSDDPLNSMSQTTALFWKAMSAIFRGRENTRWKYGTGSSSASRPANHSLAAMDWHFGQQRLRQEL